MTIVPERKFPPGSSQAERAPTQTVHFGEHFISWFPPASPLTLTRSTSVPHSLLGLLLQESAACPPPQTSCV